MFITVSLRALIARVKFRCAHVIGMLGLLKHDILQYLLDVYVV